MKQNMNCQTDRSLSRFFYTPASNTLILALLIFAGALMQKHVSQAAGTKGNYAEGNGLKMYYESSWIWLERIPAGSASRRIWLRGRMERCASDTCKDPKSYRRRVTGARACCRPRPAAGLRANGGRHRGVVETVEDQIGGFLRLQYGRYSRPRSCGPPLGTYPQSSHSRFDRQVAKGHVRARILQGVSEPFGGLRPARAEEPVPINVA